MQYIRAYLNSLVQNFHTGRLSGGGYCSASFDLMVSSKALEAGTSRSATTNDRGFLEIKL